VPPAAFFPRPKVMSTILQLSPLDRPRYPLKDWDTFRRLVRGSFNQRRKMLRRSLRDLPGLPEISTVDGLEPWLDKRPDSISPEDFVTMANLLADHQPPSAKGSDDGES
jgi:16S rRNA (adenine1518-N6/adenine1519-N6)-dimethyltransferase